MAEVLRLYWDTSVFLCFLNPDEDERRKICEDILQRARLGDVRIYTSCYTISEVIRPKTKSIPLARRLTEQEADKIRAMFRWPFIRTIELDQRTAELAAQLALDYEMLPADCVQAASAILWKLGHIYAWDRDFGKLKGLIGVASPNYISPNQFLPGMEPVRVGPHPDDFSKKPGE